MIDNYQRFFVDTNILVYAHDISSKEKHSISKNLIWDLCQSQKGCISIQVLQEFYVTITRKVKNPLDKSIASAIIMDLGKWMTHKPDANDILNAITIQDKYNLKGTPVTLLTAAGKVFDQKTAVEFSLREKLVFLCGHYKGIDQRVIDNLITEQISIGDFILTGGELPAMCIIDAVVRLLPGAIGDFDSADTDSFQTGLLDHPHYTRPVEFRGMKVPEVLMSGHHEKIKKWQKTMAFEITKKQRMDLYNKYVNSD